MVQAAHQEHDNQAQAVDKGTEKAGGSTGFYQEQHQPRDTEQRADPVGNGVADFFQDGPPRRFVHDPGILLQ